MQIPFALIFAVLFSVETIAAPVASLSNESGLEVRKAKAVAKKPAAKPVAKKPVAKKPVAKKPVAKKPVAKPVAKKPAAKAPAKKPPVKAPAKKPAPVKKPAAATKKPVKPVKATTAKKPAPIKKKPAAKPKSPATKKPVTKAKIPKKPAAPKPAAKKPVVKSSVAKKPVPPKKAPAKSAAKPAAKAPAKTAAKPAAKAPAKAAPAKKPTKAAPAKKPTASKAAAKPAASACALPGAKAAAPAKASKPKRMLNELTRRVAAFAHEVEIADRTLFGLIQPRLTSGNEFVGWHGTNINTATLWESRGEIVKPTNVEGQTIGKSGLDSELGPGLYISDTLSVAEAAAAINSQTNKVAGKVCAIFAKSSSSWRSSVDKVQIPEKIRGNANIKEQERASYITNLPPAKKGGAGTMRIGPLRGVSTNQMLIPESQNPKFEAQCFDITGLDSADAQAFEKAGNKITYTSSSLISEWKIRKEDAELATATVAAFEKKCT
ncbi:hypothetical protein B0H16DRAFT_1014677 [Mycena metata]|uniref:PARP catalytic domain-containing protein n=1 Tax=Mycena metata TaxID=1033252 RepID=A0AAD7IJP7_9AGAR|nr:hypothetical protein B0H16DRAFT_1014677 [Mycena metata]